MPKFEFEGKTFDTKNRPGKLSGREYFAQVTGQPKEEAPFSSSSKKVKTIDDASDFINSEQSLAGDIEPEIRKSLERFEGLTREQLGFSIGDLERPGLPEFEKSFLRLREERGVSGLEESINELTSQADALKTQLYIDVGAERAKSGLTPRNIIEGRIGEQERTANERLLILNDQITTINNQLNTAYGVIDSIMKFKGMDFNAATDAYDTDFRNAMSTINLVRGIDQDIKNERERQRDRASANLQIMYNSIAENSEGIKSLSSSQQSAIIKLELQAGLPAGFYETIESKNPGGQVVTTNNYKDDLGREFTAVVIRDPKTGKLTTQNIFVGQGTVPKGERNATTRTQTAISETTNAFENLRGGDGKVAPEVWNDYRRTWTGSLSDFDSRFKSFINPDRVEEYNGFENFKSIGGRIQKISI